MGTSPSRDVVGAVHAHLASVAVVFFKEHQITRAASQLVDGDIPADLMADMVAGGVILTSAHLGHWELLPALLPSHFPSKRSLFLYRPLRNQRVDEMVKRHRSAAGAVPVALGPGVNSALAQELLKGACVAILPDVRPLRTGITVSFLASRRTLPPGLAALHIRSGAPVWLALVLSSESPDGSISRRPFSLVFVRILHRRNQGDAVPTAEFVMQAYASSLGPYLAAHPLQYLWSHNMTANENTT